MTWINWKHTHLFTGERVSYGNIEVMCQGKKEKPTNVRNYFEMSVYEGK